MKRAYCRGTVAERLATHSTPSPDSDCRLWTGCTTSGGYGQLRINGRAELAHRLSFLERNGPIADGLFVLHRCDTPRCINPDHLFAGDAKANARDMVAKGRHQYGAERWNAKVTDDVARQILASADTNTALAHRFGIDASVVSRIRNRRIWTHVDGRDGGQNPNQL